MSIRNITKIVIVLVYISNNINGQVKLDWQSCYNGPANGSDTGFAITVDDSGYVYVTGSSVGIGTDRDYATIKYTPNGDSVWVRRWNSPENQFDLGRDIAVDNTGNVYVTGAPVTLKYDSSGELLWESDNIAECIKIQIDEAGYIYAAGTGFGDFVLRKLSSSGEENWKRTYDGPASSQDRLNDMILDSQGNIIVTGQSHGIGTHWDYATVKYSPEGDTIWIRRYNGPAPTFPGDYAYAITVDDNDNVYVTGWSDGADGRAQCFTIAYSSDGDSLWSHRYPAGGNLGYAGYDIAYHKGGYIYVVARSHGYDDTLLKYDPDGNLVWSFVYNTYNFAAPPPRLALDKTGNIYLMSHSGETTRSDYVVVKISRSDELVWEYKYPGTGTNTTNNAMAIAVDEKENIYLTGRNAGLLCVGGGFNYLTIKLSEDTATSVPAIDLLPSEFQLLPAYPNPFNSSTNITFTLPYSSDVDMKIYNILGEEITTLISDNRSAGTHTVQWIAGELPSGMYLCRLQSENEQRVIKLLLMK